MNEILRKYRKGQFLFRKGDNLKKVCKAPDLPGVYLFFAVLKTGKEELRYIGKSGSILQNGTFKKQLLCGRICNKQDRVNREIFLTGKIEKEDLGGVKVEWFVTYENGIKDLPGYVEGLLIQSFFKETNLLPSWNTSF